MNKYLRVLGIFSLLCFSFYYTEQIAKFMQSKDPIYESIRALEGDYEEDFVNAVIREDTIIPGLYGQRVNLEKSFQKMKNYGFFKEEALVFDETKPDISLEENKDKIIKRGNSLKYAVTFLLNDEKMILYFEELGLPYAVLTTKENVDKVRVNGTKINADKANYEEVEKQLKLQNARNEYCFLGNFDSPFCQAKQKLSIQESLKIHKSNFVQNYNKVQGGDIIFLDGEIDIKNLKVFLESILFRGLDIISLESMLKETRY